MSIHVGNDTICHAVSITYAQILYWSFKILHHMA